MYNIINMGKNNKPWSDDIQEYIVEQYKQGKNTMELAKEFGSYNTTIRRILIKHNVNLISTSDRIRIVKTNPFSILENSNTQYWVGYLIADGCIDTSRKCIRLFSKDRIVLENFKEFLNYPVAIKSEFQKEYNVTCYNIGFNNNEAYDSLVNLGFNPNKSHNFLYNNELTWDLIRGYFDGDGHFTYQQNTGKKSLMRPRIGFTSGSLEFLQQVQLFLINNGITDCKIKLEKPGGITHALYIIRKGDIDLFYDSIYNNARYFLNRKYQKFGSYYEEIHRLASH